MNRVKVQASPRAACSAVGHFAQRATSEANERDRCVTVIKGREKKRPRDAADRNGDARRIRIRQCREVVRRSGEAHTEPWSRSEETLDLASLLEPEDGRVALRDLVAIEGHYRVIS